MKSKDQSFTTPQIILLRDGTDHQHGKKHLISNLSACIAVVDVVRSTLGPRGMDKLIIDTKGKGTITNDGATIMKKLDIAHPAAKIMVDIAMSQDSEVGDGTTTVCLLCAEFLQVAKQFLLERVHPRNLLEVFRYAARLAVARVREVSWSITGSNRSKKQNFLEKCAAASMNSKLLSEEKTFFAEMVVTAVSNLRCHELDLSMIGIKQVNGGGLRDSILIDGVAFKKTFSYAGFEQQPKKIKTPQILIINIELELKAEGENAEIHVKDPSAYQSILDAEWSLILEKLKNCVSSGAQIILSSLAIGDLATQFFADHDVFCAGRVGEDDLRRVAEATGAKVQSTLNNLEPSVLGYCDLFEERRVGNDRYNFFVGCSNTHSVTMILRGGSEQYIDEVQRSVHDAIMIVKKLLTNPLVVAGGGAIDAHISKYLSYESRKVEGKNQLFVAAYAKALEVIPKQLCTNAGYNATDVLNKLRKKHRLLRDEGINYGVDLNDGGVCNAYNAFIWEPSEVFINALQSATEASCLLMSIDDTVRIPKSDQHADDTIAAAAG